MRLLLLTISIFITYLTHGQFPKFHIGGLARSLSTSAHLDKEDTINNDISQDFNIVFDLAIKGELNKHVNLYSELRLGSNLEVFDTSSSYLNLRRLLIFGDLNDYISFEIGDIDLQMTPFTLWNSNEEGEVNENSIFSNYRDIQRYENFNNGNNWRRQGVTVFGNKSVSKNDTISYKFFGTREFASNGISNPDIYIFGGDVNYDFKNFYSGINYIDLFSNNKGISLDTNFHNHVVSSKSALKIKNLEFSSELGLSKLTNSSSTLNNKWIDGEFVSLGFKANFSKNLFISLNYRSVSDDFSSPGAQTKRINYSMSPNLFPQVSNSLNNREVSVNEIITDINFIRSQSFYNRTIDYSLDKFNPIFGVSEPYGLATPNRRGFSSKIQFNDTSKTIYLYGKCAVLSDLIGEGVDQKRKYLSFSIASNVYINKILNFNKTILFKSGFYYSNSKRKHSPEIFVDDVDFNNSILDIGIEMEAIKNFYLIFGYKSINASGIDYLSVRNDDFIISSFDKLQLDINQKISSFGLKYNFNKKSSLLFNYQEMKFSNNLLDSNFKIDQFFILVQIKF